MTNPEDGYEKLFEDLLRESARAASDFDSDYDWINIVSLEKSIGQRLDEMDFLDKMKTIFNYYGYMEIFGSTYHSPFEIFEYSFPVLLARVLEELLECTELNLDEMEPETVKKIEEANKILKAFKEG